MCHGGAGVLSHVLVEITTMCDAPLAENRRVLVVDDDANFGRTLCDLLRSQGFTATALHDGREAIEAIEEQAPCVAVIDLRLKDMTGLDIMRSINRDLVDTECILLTGHASQESAIEAVSLGAYSYVEKPCAVDQLILQIRRACERWESQRALRASQERYREIVNRAEDIIYTHDEAGNFTSVNPAMAHTYGYTVEEMSQLNVADIVEPEYLHLAHQKTEEQAAQAPQTGPYELLTRGRSGRAIWIEVSTRIVDGGDRPYEVQSIARDISERKQAEEALHTERARSAVLLEQFPFGVVIVNRDGRYEYLNAKFVEIFGYTLEDIPTGHDWFDKAYPDPEYKSRVISTWLGDLQGTQHGEARPRTFTVRCKDGSDKVIHFKRVNMHGGDQLLVCEDITERKQAEDTIRQLAYHDALTGLPNRALFNDRIDVALAHARRNGAILAVLLLDLDHFKRVNDTLGHATGDKLLQAVGQRLTTLLRDSDTVCRMGGDEFLILLTGIAEAEDVAKVAERILQAMREPFVLDGPELSITTSVGIAVYPEDGEDGDALITNTDFAMYMAKQQGRDNCQRYVASARQHHPVPGRAQRKPVQRET
jgi:diguanylate cyclase (GGDEF)-like protein/PAS domain S-box-containing protein